MIGDVADEGTAGDGSAAGLTAGAKSACPQSPQNLLVGGLVDWHSGQTRISGCPQSPQKRFLSGLALPQLVQFTTPPHELPDALVANGY